MSNRISEIHLDYLNSRKTEGATFAESWDANKDDFMTVFDTEQACRALAYQHWKNMRLVEITPSGERVSKQYELSGVSYSGLIRYPPTKNCHSTEYRTVVFEYATLGQGLLAAEAKRENAELELIEAQREVEAIRKTIRLAGTSSALMIDYCDQLHVRQKSEGLTDVL